MTQVPPPPVPTPQSAIPPSFAEGPAVDAARARIDAGLAAGDPDAPPTAPAPAAVPAVPGAPAGDAPPTELDFFSDDGLAGLNFDGMQYRDGKKLEGEIRKARDAYKPFRDAFAGLSDTERQALLDGAPTLGSDLATLTGTLGRLHEDDRQWFTDAMAVLADDPVEGAKLLAQGAADIQAAFAPGGPGAAPAPPVGGQPIPDWAQPPAPAAPEEAPLTRAEFDRLMNERATQEDFARQTERIQAEILAEARDLGYDPEAAEGTPERARFAFLLSTAGQPGVGDISKAHTVLEGIKQSTIDSFIQAKAADAGRPIVPSTDGTTPVAPPRELSTLPDAAAAMRSRMDAQLGPDPRRRSTSD